MQKLKTRAKRMRETRNKTQLPLAEGIVKKKRRPNGFFSRMNDQELVEYAQGVIDKKEIMSKVMLEKCDSGLYDILLRRKLINKLDFPVGRMNFNLMSNHELIDIAKNLIDENHIKTRNEFNKKFRGLREVFRKRGLWNKLDFSKGLRNWLSKNDDEIMEIAQQVINENEIQSGRELEKLDSGLHAILKTRGLLKKVAFPRVFRTWSSKTNEEICKYAKKFLKKNTIKTRHELHKADVGLYSVLNKRNLFEAVGLNNKNANHRKWALVNDDKLVSYAQKMIKKGKIRNVAELQKQASGLYKALWRRKLLNQVFSTIEKSRQSQAAQNLIDGLQEFGGLQ